MVIRKVLDGDAAALLSIHQQVNPRQTHSARELRTLLDAAAFAQVAEIRGQVVGYAAALPVPGLAHMADLTGAVAPTFQRRGIGRELLKALVPGLRPQGVQVLTFSLADVQTPAGLFLLANGFNLHHEEWELIREGGPSLALPTLPTGFAIRQLTRNAAAITFRRLYDESFGPHPWYQPYTDDELFNLFPRQGLPRFLLKGDEAVGFVWYWSDARDEGVIEPLGVAAAHQGQGLGRQLMLTALHELQRKSVHRVKIGAWRENAAAVHLYESLGFYHTKTIAHLQLTMADANSIMN
jgi:mycothiol synthase